MGGILPLLLLASDAAHGLLGANPLQRALHQTGQLALVLLLLSLACTPLRLLAGQLGRRLTWPARIRKALGMLAFGYAALHFCLYLLDQGLVPASWLTDIYKRPFITAGLLALLLLTPLALTSTPRSVARLGFARWTRLHSLVYPAAVLATLHYWWAVKQDRAVPFVAALVLAGLLLLRWLLRPPKR